ADVMSVYSSVYENIPGTEFNPNWNQTTAVSFMSIEGNETMKYSNFNYQGTQFANSLNVSTMETLHIDMWTANANSVNVFCISTGPVETAYSLPITPKQWVSYNIPLTAFTGVNMTDLIQFKYDGGNGSQIVYLDNIYFYRGDVNSVASLQQHSVRLYPNPVKSGGTVQFSAEVDQIDVFDAVGSAINSVNKPSLRTDGLNQGVYFLRIHTKDGRIQTQRLVVN
ncbi:MAG: T9SS type A sorting domain-containing protein, partial [Ignavibacteria bacterium]|nr:T9SS type A sorting domain-containing protein [Ignavibacteria bacterium]